MGPLYLLTMLPPFTIPVLVFGMIMWIVGRIRGRTLIIIFGFNAVLRAVAWWVRVESGIARARLISTPTRLN